MMHRQLVRASVKTLGQRLLDILLSCLIAQVDDIHGIIIGFWCDLRALLIQEQNLIFQIKFFRSTVV